jgi:methylated-DNA-protein-cysteine methyltransferase-like protein
MAPGERSEEVHLWYTAVYEAVQEIPYGKVTSYGHIARLLGKREHCLAIRDTTKTVG